jgi:hypothetical protein
MRSGAGGPFFRSNLRDDPAFDMDSECWEHPANEPCPRRRSGLLDDAEYDYDADPYPQQQVPHWVPSPPEEDNDEEEHVMEAPVLMVEQYQPLDLSDEDALQRAIEESELIELGNWEGLGAQLAASASTSRGGASSSRAGASTNRVAPPPPPPPAVEPRPWGYAVWDSLPRVPPIQVNWGPLAFSEPQTPPQTSPRQPPQAPAPASPALGMPMVPWSFP